MANTVDKSIIISARAEVLQNDPNIAKVIHDVRGEAMGDKEVHEHVEKAIAEATRNRILEAVDDDDNFDLGDDFDLGLDDDETDDNDGNDDFDDDEFDGGDDESSADDDGLEADDFETSTLDPDAIRAEVEASKRGGSTSSGARALIRSVGHFFELTRVDYLDTIDALYKKAIETGTHRDTYNLLTFIKFIGVKDLTAAFAFMDIPNTDLSEVFSHMSLSENTFITVDGMFYKSTFNNDSILEWPWPDLRPCIDIFKECPFDNLEINKVAGRKILQIAGVDSTRASEIDSFSSSTIDAIRKANTH